MSDAFQDRENTFEKEFAHDETLRFKATARRNKALAHWVAEQTGVSGPAADKYAEDFMAAQIGTSDNAVAAALKAELARANADVTEHRLLKRMAEEMAKALESVKAGT